MLRESRVTTGNVKPQFGIGFVELRLGVSPYVYGFEIIEAPKRFGRGLQPRPAPHLRL